MRGKKKKKECFMSIDAGVVFKGVATAVKVVNDGHVYEATPEAHSHHNHLDAHSLHSHLHYMHHHATVQRQRLLLLFYMFATCVYFSICIALLVANTMPDDVIDAEYFLPFHLLEFWGQCAFTILEAFVLVHSQFVPLLSVPSALFVVNVVASTTAALLFSINGHIFDRTAHWIEYCVQITVVLANFVFILFQNGAGNSLSKFLYRWRYVECVFVIVMLGVSIVQLLVFVPVIHTAIQVPDQAAHYFEYTGEMANCVVVFIFALALFLGVNKQFDEHVQQLNGHFD
jgi:hypothetical protein